MAQGGAGNQSPATLFQARLDTSDGVSNTLTLARYQGDKVVVSGLTVPIPSAGLTRDVADNLIDATGADAGAPPSASTLYYVYISNKRSPFSPESIRLSATSPSYVNGVKYLGTSGNALNWRFVGWVRPNATPEFESSVTNRWIVNYYNRQALGLFADPGYLDNDTFNTISIANTTYAPLNGGVDSVISFISNGEDAVSYDLKGCVSDSGGGGQRTEVGVGEDSASTPAVTAFANVSGGNFGYSVSAGRSPLLPEGAHTLHMLCLSSSGNGFVYVETQRNGAAADPHCTYLSCVIPG